MLDLRVFYRSRNADAAINPEELASSNAMRVSSGNPGDRAGGSNCERHGGTSIFMAP